MLKPNNENDNSAQQDADRQSFLDEQVQIDRKLRQERLQVLEKDSLAFEVEITGLLESVGDDLKRQLGLADEIVVSTKETVRYSEDSTSAKDSK